MSKNKNPSLCALHVDIDVDLFNALNKVIPWGSKRVVLEVVLLQLVSVLSGEGKEHALGAILHGHVDLFEKFQQKNK